MENIIYIILLFIIYSMIGYVIEVIAVFINSKFTLNRGFLIGPYLPIYGFGALIVVLMLDKYQNDYFVLFIASFVLCGLLEYVTSYLMEKIYGLRWWDYSNKKYNLQGRICLDNLFVFGIIGILLVEIINPFFIRQFDYINSNVLFYITMIFSIIIILDTILSVKVAFNIKDILKIKDNKYRDQTAEIKAEIKNKIQLLKNYSFFDRRIINAFPNIMKYVINMQGKIKVTKKK